MENIAQWPGDRQRTCIDGKRKTETRRGRGNERAREKTGEETTRDDNNNKKKWS